MGKRRWGVVCVCVCGRGQRDAATIGFMPRGGGRVSEINTTTDTDDKIKSCGARSKPLVFNKIKKIKPAIVFGCGGDRDKSKRKSMALIANKYAGKIYITDDNPRNENPSKIRKNILKYCSRGIEVSDRRKAIKVSQTLD